MRRFEQIWRVRRLEDGFWAIIGKHGYIVPDNYPVKHYMVCCKFPSVRMANSRLSTLDSSGIGYEITQGPFGGDVTLRIVNYDVERLLHALRPVINLYVRKHYPHRELAGIARKVKIDAENMKSLHA